MNESEQFCPICQRPVQPFPRYPHYICQECAQNPVDETGRPLTFFNLSVFGGYGAKYADTDEPYDSHICYINGVQCYANEARFGGIVIQPLSTLDR